tara:strand:- start:325 stop:936 length:612 start_codon:yes stop_codon:yes gene_type:complete
MKTIGFFGDSFCASNQPESWCNILQEKLGADRIRYFGNPGRSIWSTMFKFNGLIEQNRVPDISVFCWSEPYRLYHPNLIMSANTEPMDGVDPNVYKALDDYWKYLQNYDKDEMAYEYALKYYDQAILSKVDKQIVQMWSFKPFETADKDAKIELTTGTFIDESMFAFSKSDGEKDGWGEGTINHMTVEQNQQWAEKVHGRLRV